jgi:HEAT repeat protein
MQSLDELFDAIAAGEVPAPGPSLDRKRLIARTRSLANKGEVPERLKGVQVAGALQGQQGMEVLSAYTTDADLSVRRGVFDVAVNEGAYGIGVLRAMVADADEDLALDVLGRLERVVDRPSAVAVRRVLQSESPKVRAAAASLLGHIGGGSMLPFVRRLNDDSDEAVREASAEAEDRLMGKLPKGTPDPWWEDAAAMAAADEVPDEVVETLPDPLPVEGAALLRLLGQAAPNIRAPIIEALRVSEDALWSIATTNQHPGGEPATARGICRAAIALNRQQWIVPIRRRLPDPNSSVRLEVAEALGALGKGKASLVMGLVDLLIDPVAEVRVAGARALGQIGIPGGRGFLQKHVDHKDDAMRAAVKEALEALG